MRVISVCSGAGGMDLGFHRAGFRTVALCEWLPWLRELLAVRFPGVPCWPDLTTLDPAELPGADVLIGGTPCTDLSVTGRREGLHGAKSRLFYDFIRVRNATGVEWAVWENVEGALSSNKGMDFACVLGAFVGADVHVPAGGWPGAGVAAGPWGGCVWRVLDAQHFGVPQRRRRVFVVGRLGGPCPPEVLLEPAGGRRDLEASEGPREEDPRAFGVRVAGTLGALTGGSRTTDLDGHGAYVGAAVPGLADPRGEAPDPDRVRASDGLAGRLDGAAVTASMDVASTLTGGAHAPGVSPPGRREEDDKNLVIVGVSENQRGEVLCTPYMRQITTGGGKPGQGYPLVAIAGTVPAGVASRFDLRPDARRYSGAGNGVAAPVTEWIGRRLADVAFTTQEAAA